MIDKRADDLARAFEGLGDGISVMIGGFGDAGRPAYLLKALLDSGIKDLHFISNNAGDGDTGLGAFYHAGRVRKLSCSFPRGSVAPLMEKLIRAGEFEVQCPATFMKRIQHGSLSFVDRHPILANVGVLGLATTFLGSVGGFLYLLLSG